jgi:D-glycero-alpha-D-manno-heptose 1-phosphate guanylyltransferase
MIDAIVLAGGLGTRLRQTVPNLPKALAPIQGVPFLQILLNQLNGSPLISRIVMALGHQSEAIADFLQKGSLVDCSIETNPLGTGGAILLALSKTSLKTLLIVNGDTFFDIDLKAFYEFHTRNKSRATLAVRYEEKEAGRYGCMEFGSDRRILNFVEKSPSVRAGWVSGGIYLIEKEMFAPFTVGCSYSMERDFLPLFLRKGVYAYPDPGVFIDIGTADSYTEAQQILKPWIPV